MLRVSRALLRRRNVPQQVPLTYESSQEAGRSFERRMQDSRFAMNGGVFEINQGDSQRLKSHLLRNEVHPLSDTKMQDFGHPLETPHSGVEMAESEDTSTYTEQDAHSGDIEMRKAMIFRNMLLDRIASENLYDIVKKNPAVYFNRAPFIDPNEGFRRADILKKLQKADFDIEKLSKGDLIKGFKLGIISADDFLPPQRETGGDAAVQKVEENIDAERTDIPWELVAMQSEFRAMLLGEPTLDSSESILKGKHITDPRQFTQEDLSRIREWDKGQSERELLNCAIESQQKILSIHQDVDESSKILQKAKQEVLEDEKYQDGIQEIQQEGQTGWDRFAEKKNARPWKASAADKVLYYGDTVSKVPKKGSYNIPAVCEQSKMNKHDAIKKNYTHFRVLKSRDVKNSGKSSLTRHIPD